MNYVGKIEPIRSQVRNAIIVTLMSTLVKITQFIEKGVFQFSKYSKIFYNNSKRKKKLTKHRISYLAQHSISHLTQQKGKQ